MEAEATIICMDTSKWMHSVKSHRFKEQADAIELYCATKLKSHPQNLVGICELKEPGVLITIMPTRDLRGIMKAIYGARIGDSSNLDAIRYAWHRISFSSYSNMQKRIVVLAGGILLVYDAEALGRQIKKRNIACDVVNFGDQSLNKKEHLDTLIAGADNNGNCRILHVEPTCSVPLALSRSLLIPQVEEVGGLSVVEERKKLERKARRASKKIQQAKMDTLTQRVSQNIQQPKIDASTQEIAKLRLEVEQKNEQIDALTRENETLKRELELSRKDKNQVLSH